MGARREDPRLSDAIALYLEELAKGERPDRARFFARYPELERELRDYFEIFDRVEAVAGPLRSVACIGPIPNALGRLGKFELEGVLGQGGMGIVYRARHTELDMTVALKMIRSGELTDGEARRRFLAEARAAAAMSHHNIVQIFDLGEHDGQPYFTMKLIEGHTLALDERDFRKDIAGAARLVAVVARAIHHAHGRKIIHRDLKPGNILIDAEGTPHVTDFGLATIVEARKKSKDPNLLIGTLPYMSPEQLSAEGRSLTTAVDLWSLGAVLYELLAGVPPFEGRDQDETAEQIRHGEPPPLRGLNRQVPADLEAICLKCLEKSPIRRHASALALAQDLERWLREETARVERFQEWTRRRELRHELLYTAQMVADRILMKLKDWGWAIAEAAKDPGLPRRLRRNDRKWLQEFVERTRRQFATVERGLAPSPYESWVLLDLRGKMIACCPNESIIGRKFSGRDWFRGALERSEKRGREAVHVSKVFISVVARNLYKFALTVPVHDGGGAAAPVIGVLGASFTTDSDFGIHRLHDEQHKVVVAGRCDPDTFGARSEGDSMVLVHPAYRRGEKAVKIDAPSLRRFAPQPTREALDYPDPGQACIVDEEYIDPLARKDERYRGLWWAGIAPVGNTPFLAVVQRRPPRLLEREAEIVVGLMVDLTGLTASVGEPYAEGIQDYAAWLNAQGGIGGKMVRLIRVDYANRISEARQIYAGFKSADQVVAIHGWGTGDTEALREQASRDEIPYFSASYSAHLADPSKAPYNFFVVADYSTQIHGGLKYLRDSWKSSRRPRVAFLFPDLPFGTAPIQAGLKHAHELGFEIVGQEQVALDAMSAVAELRKLKKARPDFTWIGGSTPSTAVILRDARKLGLWTQFFVNIWGNDETLLRLAGEATDGVLGLQASALFRDDVPGMKAIREVTGSGRKITHYVRGWVSMMVLCEGLRRAERRGDLTGPGIKKALETLRDFDTQGLTPPITYTSSDHRPSMEVRVYEFSKGKMRHRATVDVERRPEWLGI